MNTDDLLKLNEAQGFLELGDWQTANEVLESTAPATRATYQALCLRCAIYGMAGRWDMVQPVAETLAAEFPEEWRPSYILAQCFTHQGYYRIAREHLRYAIDHSQQDIRALALDDPLLEPLWMNIGEE